MERDMAASAERINVLQELAHSLRELGGLQESEALTKAQLFNALPNLGVTERVASTNHGAAHLTGAILKLQAEIRALEYDLQLAFLAEVLHDNPAEV